LPARLTLPLISLALILSACSANTGGSATETTICRELRRALPDWSSRDTAETLASGARFMTVFGAVCPAIP
jgi:post-segregation antitoxin (ccd killing protein)